MEEPIVNRVAQSGLVSLDLEELVSDLRHVSIDISEALWEGLILKEKDFRAWVKEKDWSAYQDQYVSVYCSADAIVPFWAYMLIASKAAPFASNVFLEPPEQGYARSIEDFIDQIDAEKYREARVVVKGCSDKAIPVSAYVAITNKLQPVVKTLMFGEPCSTVPVYKEPRKKN